MRIQDLHKKESIFNENIAKYQRDLKDAQVNLKQMQLQLDSKEQLMKQLEDKLDMKQEALIEVEQTLAQQQFKIAELAKQNHDIEKTYQAEAAHLEYLIEEANKQIQTQEVQIQTL